MDARTGWEVKRPDRMGSVLVRVVTRGSGRIGGEAVRRSRSVYRGCRGVSSGPSVGFGAVSGARVVHSMGGGGSGWRFRRWWWICRARFGPMCRSVRRRQMLAGLPLAARAALSTAMACGHTSASAAPVWGAGGWGMDGRPWGALSAAAGRGPSPYGTLLPDGMLSEVFAVRGACPAGWLPGPIGLPERWTGRSDPSDRRGRSGRSGPEGCYSWQVTWTPNRSMIPTARFTKSSPNFSREDEKLSHATRSSCPALRVEERQSMRASRFDPK